jgi:hypothetical protein
MNSGKIPAQELIELLESLMDFERWGFKQSHFNIAREIFPEIIYDSEMCRVKFAFEHAGEQPPLPPRLKTLYGRSHALDNDDLMTVHGENYWCWHDVHDALRFLDGMTPKEAADEWKAYQRRTPFVRNLVQTLVEKKIPHPEREIRIQAAIWEHYGQKLFEIYDIRNPATWEKYAEFINEFHNLVRLEAHFGFPTKDKIW